MRMKVHWLCVLLTTASGGVALAQQPGGDPLHNLLISPEVLVHHREEIGLSEAQVQQIHTRLETAGRQVQEVQRRANGAMQRLAQLLSADRVDEEAALKQLDEVLAIEKDHKRLHMRIMIQIRNELTAKQRQLAANIKRTATFNEDLEQRLKAKLSRIYKEVSPEQVRAEFAALKKEDVAWRRIQWKTCLLDGLKASREQHKPIMLWIFIDRPIDDQRC